MVNHTPIFKNQTNKICNKLYTDIFTLQPIQLLNYTLEVAKPGRLPAGKTEIPFELPVKAKGNKELYETYHGVFVNIQVQFKIYTTR